MADVDEQRALQEISMPSTEIDDVSLTAEGGALTLGFVLPARLREAERGIRFEGIRAYRHRAESHCTVWHIDAYDTITLVERSSWVAELVEATPDDLRDRFPMRHFMIYLDSMGCYEVVAESWRFIPAEAQP
jgi:hypothetical protein